MKKIATITALSTLALSGFSQGYINFQNFITTQLYFFSTANTANKVTSATIGSQPAGAFTGSSGVVDVGLYWSTAMFTDAAQGTLADDATMSSTAGTFAGNSDLGLAGTSPGQTIYVQVFAWDSTFANPDADLAGSGFFGAWSAGQANTLYGAVGAAEAVTLDAGPPAPSAIMFGTSAPLFGRAVLITGPEPTSLALGTVGMAALWLFRRRK